MDCISGGHFVVTWSASRVVTWSQQTKHRNRLGISTFNLLLTVKFNVPQKCYEPKPNKGAIGETNEIVILICSCHNFFSLSSVQILFIPACWLLCVL